MAEMELTPDRTPQGWGKVASEYDTHIARNTRMFALDALEATGLKQGEKVLDVAAGSGALSLEAARRGAKVLATDFSPEMIGLLKRRAKDVGLEIDARVMDGQALELEDGSFDAAYSVFGMMFFPSPEKGMAEMRRVLREGGRCGLVVWNVPEASETFSSFFEALNEAVPDLPPPEQPPAVFSLADPDDLARRLEGAGFRDVEVRQVSHMFEDESPEAAWTGMTTSNPVLPGILGKVGPENAQNVKDAYMRIVGQRMREGKVALKAEAHLATGTV